jgi:hypothetical protein
MGLMQRFSMIFKDKASKRLDRYEDLQETPRDAAEDAPGHGRRGHFPQADRAAGQQLQQSAAKLDARPSRPFPHDKFQQSAEQLPQRLLSRLAKSWRARQADILTRHANGGCSNGCTGAINLLIRRSSASARFRDFANCLATAAAMRCHVADSPDRKTASRSPRLVAWSQSGSVEIRFGSRFGSASDPPRGIAQVPRRETHVGLQPPRWTVVLRLTGLSYHAGQAVATSCRQTPVGR